MAAPLGRRPVDDLIDEAIAALNRGDVAGAHDLATEVLAADASNLDAGDLLLVRPTPHGEIRRLTVMFCDLVGSTELSSRLEPEAYHEIVLRYQELCRSIVEGRYGGWVVAFRGDGVLASFGFPVAHENDLERAVLAGLDLLEGVEALGDQLVQEGSDRLRVRVAVHKGLVYLDSSTKDLYGLAVNVAARLEGLAEVGTLLVSDEVAQLVAGRFDLQAHQPREVKGVTGPLVTHTVRGERQHGTQLPRPFVGRAAEMDVLRAAWSRTRAGERSAGDCVAVVGEPGIGKSRLAEAIVQGARADGATVLTLRGSPLHPGVGLWPIRALVEDACGFTRQTDGAARVRRVNELVAERGLAPETVPLFAAVLDLDPAISGYTPEESGERRLRERIGDAGFDLLLASVTDTGTVIVAEDLHWFDDESRDLLGRLVRHPDPRLLVVVTSRNPADAPRGDRTALIHLEPLGSAERLALARAVGGSDLPPDALHDLTERSDGIPLYVEELVRTALRGAVRTDDGPTPPRTSAPSVPDVLYEPLVARLQGTAHGVSVAAAVATIGREADRGLLGQVSELSSADLEEALIGLLGVLVLERADPDRYRFRHELVREVAYDLQPPSRRRDLHGRVADALVGDAIDADAVDWAVVAGHYETAGRVIDAADAFDKAGRAARRRGALIEARDLLGRAIELVSATADDTAAVEVDLRLQRGFLAISLEGNSSAVAAADYERCLELSLPLGDSDALFSTLLAIWSYYAARAEFDRTDELLAVLGRMGGERREVARMFSTGGSALVAFYRGEFRKALALAEEVLEVSASLKGITDYTKWWYVPIDPVSSYITMPSFQRVVMGDPSDLDAALLLGREANLSLPFPQGPFTHAGVLAFDVWMRLEAGDAARAWVSHEEMVDLADRYGFDQWAMVAATQREMLSGYALLACDTEEDRAALARHAATIGGYMAMWKMVDQYVAINYYLTIQGLFHAAAGERDEARACLEDSLAIASRTGQRLYDAETLRHLANLQESSAGRVEGLRTAIRVAQHQGAAMYEVRAARDLCDATGDLGPLADAVGGIPASASYPELEAARSRLRH